MIHTDTTLKTSVGEMKPSAPTWPGTPAEWDAERERKVGQMRAALEANGITVLYSDSLPILAESVLPPRPVEPPLTCVWCGCADEHVLSMQGHTYVSHYCATKCRDALLRELRALRDGPTPQYEVCGWSRFDSSGKMFSTWSTESQAKNAQREYGGTAHAIYKRVDVERAK